MTLSTPSPAQRGGLTVVLMLPAGLLLALSFNSGGFFPDGTAVAAFVTLVLLLLRAASAATPFAGLSPALTVGGISLIAFAVWTLASGSWSGSAARALLEFNRTLL